MAIKLTPKMLRGLIREAISPRRRFNENLDRYEAVAGFASKQADAWRKMYDEGDPSMSHLGQDAWRSQVSAAEDELINRIDEVVEEIEEKLVNGEFHLGELAEDDEDIKLPPRHPRARDEEPRTAAKKSSSPKDDTEIELPPMHPRGKGSRG